MRNGIGRKGAAGALEYEYAENAVLQEYVYYHERLKYICILN